MDSHDPHSEFPHPDPAIGDWFDPAELPAWARTHIPTEPLVIDEKPARTRTLPTLHGRKAPTQAASRGAGETTDELPIVTQVDKRTQEPPSSARPHVKRGVLAMAAGVMIAVVSAAVGVAMASPDHPQPAPQVAAPQEPATKPAETLVADFCPDRTEGTTVTTSGPGTVSSAAGVIAAFDYAYYAQRDGQRVHDLMTNPPNTAAVIQDAIDDVADDTRACVTTRPTDDPLVFDVDVKLDNPNGADGALRQRITVAKTGTTYKIALVEDR